MRIVTIRCSDCGTVVAANELETHRVMKCPGLGCERILRFEDLPADQREHVLANMDRYGLQNEG